MISGIIPQEERNIGVVFKGFVLKEKRSAKLIGIKGESEIWKKFYLFRNTC
jgi:hypothetical protein